MRSLDVQTSSIAHPLGLTIGALALVISSRNLIARTWAEIITFWCRSSGIEIAVSVRPAPAFSLFRYPEVALRLASPLPGDEALTASFALAIAAMLAAYVCLRRLLPLAYLVWAISIIHLCAVAAFYFSPTMFPYTIAGHVSSSLEIAQMLLAIVPLILMVAYYPLNFSLGRKLALTLCVLGMVFLFAPHLYACHIVVMSFHSVLYMPILFAVFGALPIMVMVVAIYGWGMSWEHRR